MGPDGRCAFCVEGESPSSSERRIVLVVLAVAMLGGVGPASYYFYWKRHAKEQSAEASRAEKRARARAEAPPRERWVDTEQRPMDVVVPAEPAPVEARPRRHRARRRARRSGQAAGPSASRSGRATRPVKVVMYMAPW